MLFTFSYKPLGKVQKRLIEASDLEHAKVVAAKYCEKKNLTLIPQSVEPAIVADEEILTEADRANIAVRMSERKAAADREEAAQKRQDRENAKSKRTAA